MDYQQKNMSVLVTGATGFIAQHIVNDLLKQGYKVIGTVRSEDKGKKLKSQFGNNDLLEMEVVPDIAQPRAFDDIFKKYSSEIKVVLHTASPFHFRATDYEKELLIPAIQGTKGLLQSIMEFGSQTVEHVVITSSIAAIKDTYRFLEKDLVYTEDNWNPISWSESQLNPQDAYRGSKNFAEKAAWDFLQHNKGLIKLNLTTINPALIFGPQLFAENITGTLNTSAEVINSFLQSMPDRDITNIRGDFVDVRDVSKAHLLAFQNEEAIGKRLGLSAGQFNGQDLAEILNRRFQQLRGVIPPCTSEGAYKIQPYAKFDNSKTKEILGFEFITLEKSLCDTAAQILKKEY
ncbi:hypothetical protein HG535_0B07070 [Zygotorulaspora mrakii]|uniref:3-beta hydroxysteroid dehydrogenase/isomerase domain-containing protein n=1 Tax=Zygotorulaspora mrakii TaxID=42260 RepID=A0A7H9AZ25_ZYGMR|nr:uncharacterized protein HG535_0B07070 [Zygotorulaspora mrakii]QLG71660.1 hypothetical protein HG535_0B07070 [Zygotorulaspora mrakii]